MEGESGMSGGGMKRMMNGSWLTIQHGFDKVIDIATADLHLIRKEGDLFFGTALSLIGLLLFQNGKNCDGNTSDYLSCTRPSTYYYYGGWEIVLVVVGVFFILLWFVKRQAHSSKR